jgi:hypothetical protein
MAKTTLTLEAFEELFDSVSNWGRWGDNDQRGTRNYLGVSPSEFFATEEYESPESKTPLLATA